MDPAEPTPPPPAPASVFARLRASPVTFALLAVNVGAFLWVWRHGGAADMGTLLRYGANEPLHVWAGEYWRVASYMFLHGGWLHLAMNTYVSVGWSTSLERALRKKRFLFVYFASGIAGGCASVVSSWIFGPHLSVGASGALFGIIGAVLALRRRQLGSFAAFFADKGIRSLLLQIGIWTAIGLTPALHLDNAAHFGGLLTGFAATWLLTSPTPRSGWLAFAAAFGALFIVAARPWWTPEGKDANRLLAFARGYATGKAVDENGALRPWPLDVARAERFLAKGCAHGLGSACAMLADEIELTGAPDAPARADALRRRACDVDPGSCRQIH